jgi:hypothetical protein
MTDVAIDPADVIRQNAASKYTAIRANQSLNRPALMKQLAQAHLESKSQLDALRTKADADTTARQSQLSTKLLGIGSTDPSAAISHRDAQDRALAIKPGDTRTPSAMLDNATQSGDTAMSKALLGQAINVGNADLVNQYTDAHPEQQSDVEELWNLQNAPKVNPLVNVIHYASPPPSELAGLNDYQLQQLANS